MSQPTHSPQPFYHPELEVPVFEKLEEKLYATCATSGTEPGVVKTTFLRTDNSWHVVFLDAQLKKVREYWCDRLSLPLMTIDYYDNSTVEEIFIEKSLTNAFSSSYIKKISPDGEIEEEWVEKKGLKDWQENKWTSRKVLALRRTKNGVLSCEGSPAIVIARPNGLFRYEYWNDGQLSRVEIVQPGWERYITQEWTNGELAEQKEHLSSEYIVQVLQKDIAKSIWVSVRGIAHWVHPRLDSTQLIGDVIAKKSSLSSKAPPKPIETPVEKPVETSAEKPVEKPKPSEPLPEYIISLTAEQARNILLDQDKLLLVTMERFVTQVREKSLLGHRCFEFELPKEIVNRAFVMIEKGGYWARIYNDGKAIYVQW